METLINNYSDRETTVSDLAEQLQYLIDMGKGHFTVQINTGDYNLCDCTLVEADHTNHRIVIA